MQKRHHLWAVAGLLVGRYGHSAPALAEAYARQARRDGDEDAHVIWSGVAGALHTPAATPARCSEAD